MNEQRGDGHFSLWAVLTIACTVAVAAASGAWYVSRAVLGDELEQYRRSSEWNLPETLRNLGEASKQARLDLKERAKLTAFEAEADKWRSQTKELDARIDELTEENSRLAKQIVELTGETFIISAGEAHTIAPGLALGLRGSSTISKEAEIQFGDRRLERVLPGTSFTETRSGKTYVVTLLEVRSDQCTFAVTAEPGLPE